MDAWAALQAEDPEIWQVVQDEEARARSNLELIASESYPSRAVLEATGSVLTAKYAEGTRAAGTTAAARSSTAPRTWPATGRRRCSGPSTPTSSRMPAPRPTWPSSTPCWSAATR